MGYTHYVERRLVDHDQKKWDEFRKDCKLLSNNLSKIFEQEYTILDVKTQEYVKKLLPVMLNGCFLYKYPQFTNKHVLFNGSSIPCKDRVRNKNGNWEDDPNNAGHETFALNQRREVPEDTFSCCKTAHKPYDIMVTACLILYKWYFSKDVSISSDGDMEEWKPAFTFIGKVLPKGKEISLEFLVETNSSLFEKVDIE